MVVVSLALGTSDTTLITQLSLEMHPFVSSFCLPSDLPSALESWIRFVSVFVCFAFGIATRNEPRNTRPLSFGIKPAFRKTCCVRAYQLNSLSVSLYSQANYFLFILKRLVLMPSASFFPRIRHL